MYGLLLDSLCQTLKSRYGEKVLQEVREKAGIPQAEFQAQKVYSESVLTRVTKAASEITGTPVEELMDIFGDTFVTYVEQYGYDHILKVLGRNMRDFLNGLDNLHEYLKFTYPKLKPPSFFCEDETKFGLKLHYRSRRKGFLHYVMGQIKRVGTRFYNTPVDIEILKEEETLDMTHVIMKLHFDNRAYESHSDTEAETEVQAKLQMNSQSFFEVFPFHVVFNKNMLIENVGAGLAACMQDLVGHAVDEVFSLSRPLVEFTLENVLMHTNNVFELTSVDPVRRVDDTETNFSEGFGDSEAMLSLQLKGQMMYMAEWDAVIFLGTPIMDNLEKMFDTGLYINDLSMHDSSRDLVLAGTQQSAELKLALDQEQLKGKKLEESMRNLDEEMKRTDVLLYQMIPKAVADKLRNGEPAVNTCEVFDQVTILFSDVVGFTRICSQITPMAVVSMLNTMYTKFDKLTEKHRVYKVETIGDAYMVVSGAPTVTKFHAIHCSDMAFDMLNAMSELIEPSSGKSMQIRVGLHSGTVVAGVVGLKMPRYCLFGEAVNIASQMESDGEAMKINISETTKHHLDGQGYTITDHGTISIKSKANLKTYWIVSKKGSSKIAFTDEKNLINSSDNNDLPTIIETDTETEFGVKGPNVLYKPILLDPLKANGTPIDQRKGVLRKERDHGHLRNGQPDTERNVELREVTKDDAKTFHKDKLGKSTKLCTIS